MSIDHEPGHSIQPAADVAGVSDVAPDVLGMASDDGAAISGPREVSVPWSGLLIVLVWMFDNFGMSVVAWFLVSIHFLRQLYGPDWKEHSVWLGLWAVLLSLPLRLLVEIFTVCFLSEARPAQMGWTSERLLSRVAQGVGLALLFAVGAYGVQQGCEALLRVLWDQPIEEHSLTILARQGLSPLEWAVLISVAVVAAPVWEEFFFRGLIQPWAITRPWGGPVLLALVPVLAVVLRLDSLQKAIGTGGMPLFLELLPLLVALSLMPIYLILKIVCRSPVPAAIFATAMLFGWFHVRIWPSPVPLTLLGVGLGWLSWRTGSLTGPIAMHMTFNSIAVVLLLIEPWFKVA